MYFIISTEVILDIHNHTIHALLSIRNDTACYSAGTLEQPNSKSARFPSNIGISTILCNLTW